MKECSKARRFYGHVVSDKMNKSIIVLVERKVKHPMYHKYIKRSIRIHAHDEGNDCMIGDFVSISETRPISKTKSWVLVKIEKRNKII